MDLQNDTMRKSSLLMADGLVAATAAAANNSVTAPSVAASTRAALRGDAHATRLLELARQLGPGLPLFATGGLQLRRNLLQGLGVHAHRAPIPPGGCGQAMARQLVGSPHDLQRLQGLAHRQAAPGQHSIELVIHGTSDICDHGVVQRQGLLELPVVHASLHQARVDLNVGAEAMLLAEALDHLEGLRQAPGVAQDLHQDAQGVVRGRDSAGPHLVQHLQRLVHPMLLRAAVQDGVVHDFVRLELAVLLHLRQDVEGPVHVTLHAVALDDSGVRDDVWLHASLRHVFQQLRGAAHGVRLGASIKHRVVGDGVARDAAGPHLLVHDEDLLHAPRDCEALQDCGVDHGVDAAATLLVLHLLPHQVPRFLGLVVYDQSLGQAAQGNGCGLHTLLLHFRPELLHAVHIACLAVGLDHGTVGWRRELHEATPLPVSLHQLRKQIHLLDADASLDDRREKHFVDGFLDAVNELDDATQIGRLRVARQGLQDDGACHRVRFHACCLHLLHHTPHATAVLRHDLVMQQLVICDLVGTQAARSHLLDEVPGLLGLAARQVGLQQRVVTHGIHDAQTLHLLEVR
mmetsp:Transcript_77173/g.249996  ORF Transcript_77173/g.249996 Transcript_77173/m.249996 type:complete len:574 (+) Transcript_77173:54-1775(+)